MIRRLALLLLSFSGVLIAATFDKGGINGVGGRALGMGGAVSAQEGDASTLWWNPAGAALQRDFALYYQYASVLGGHNLDNVVAHRGELAGFELSYGVGYRRYLATTSSGFTEQTTLLSLAMPFTDDRRLNFGVSTKLYNTQLNNVSGGEAHGFGLDLGFLYHPPLPGEGLTLGLSVLDFETNLNWATGFADAPAQLLEFGASYRFDKGTIVEFDSEMVTDHIHDSRSSQGFRLGAERWFGLKKYEIERLAALRLGYIQSSALAPTSLSGLFSVGLGLQWRGVTLDYAFLQDVSALGESHRLSLAWQFGSAVAEPSLLPQKTPSSTATPGLSPSPTPTPEATSGKFGLVADADVFAPGNASRRQNVNYAVGLLEGAVQSYSMAITRQGTEQPLRTLKGRTLPRTIRWDGRNQQGRVVPDGSYIATLRVVMAGEGTRTAVARVDVDTRRPTVSLEAYPRIFDPADASRTVGITPRAEKLTGIPARWEILVESLEGKRVKLFEGKGTPPEKISWPGQDDHGGKVSSESLFYLSYSLEMESGALAKSVRLVLGSEITAFKEASAIKVTLVTARFLPNDEGISLEDFKGLKDAAEAVKKYGSEYLVQVLGHADSQEASGPVGPLELSFLRAKAVRDYLVDAGALDAARVKAMGFGSERPAGDNATEEGRVKNRKVDVILFTK